MSHALDSPTDQPILVTDFDGTLTRRDFYRLVMERLIPPGTPDYWSAYRAGALTHFDALRLTFEAARGGESALVEVTQAMELVPTLAADLAMLREAGWGVVVVSAGCAWYIERLLGEAGVSLDVFANPGRIEGGRVIMRRPDDSPYFSEETGVDKSAVVRAALRGGRAVAFAGDGPPDLAPALLVPGSLRFARAGADLAEALSERGESFQPFESWSEVARSLAGRGVSN
ncbi:MAG: HAD-IB family phosphatase [Isosphaeraceae bacterium]